MRKLGSKAFRRGFLQGLGAPALSFRQSRASAEALEWAEQMAAELDVNPSPYLDEGRERAFRDRVMRGRS